MEVKEYIVEEADKLFCQYGFKSVTMDDIAKHLGMSKKTIYQHFSDKDELVTILINDKLSSQECTMDFCAKSAENAVQEVFFVIVNIHEMLSSMNAILFYDLQKYHPKAWLTFKEFRAQNLGKYVMVNLERGISEGLYREELNTEIITQMRLDQIDLIFNQHGQYNMNKFNLAQIMSEITEHFLYGICNQKGLALIAKYKQQQITQP